MALISVAEALSRILSKAAPLGAETVPLNEAHGRVLAQDIVAPRPQPPADVSAMDGYAVRARDVTAPPVTLKIVGEAAAGRPTAQAVGEGQAARIFTGGAIPPGADTVVIQEHAERTGDDVTVRSGAPVGKHIRQAGIDFREGDLLLSCGRRLSGRDVMLAAAANYPLLSVYRRPRVALFATGDELVMPGGSPGPGQIMYSNGYAIAALVRSEGAETIDLGIIPDRLEETVAAVRQAKAEADILVSTGGASVGDYDLMHHAFRAESADLSFWKVALRPGRPLMHGRLGAMHALGLPGNPVSAFVCSVLFLVPLLRTLTGSTARQHRLETVMLGSDLPANDERADYLRATIESLPDGDVAAMPLPVQDSSLMSALARADCLILRDPHAPAARAGERCNVLKLPL